MEQSHQYYPPALLSPDLSWRHRAFLLAYITSGLVDPAQSAIDAGVATGPNQAAQVARRYLERPAVKAALRKALEDSGLTESAVRSVVHRWLWSDDPNASLRASELGARILGMLREPAPAVPLLPPLVIFQGVLPQADSAPAAVEASYTVEEPLMSAREQFPPLVAVSQADIADKAPPPPSKARKAVRRPGTHKQPAKGAEGTQEAKT